ncbi:MAG: cytochrome c3 family protein [Verrucomicrobiota bacterium]
MLQRTNLPPAVLLSAVGLSFIGCGQQSGDGYIATESADAQARYGIFPFTYDGPRLARSGPSSCVECHADEVAQWQQSHHAKANRPVSKELDSSAFTPTREISESGVNYRLETLDGKFWLKVFEESGEQTDYELIGVIGETPIRQYLTRLEGNKFQTISASYDVINDKWVDVFAGENRVPGEWGHWTGQGMNWNANCAYCHTTEFAKGYDFDSDRYDSRWIQQGIACAECHTGLEDHLQAAHSGSYAALPILNKRQIEDNCVTCHSRRDQLTSDAFSTGDAYHDHFSLSLPDQQGLYFPDGQIRDEVFVHASFQMSRMAHAGVSCMDCHNPHSLERILPVENNMLCMRCHENGYMDAPTIEPVAHSFHPEGSTGNQCVNCHMPKRVYMQVDPRADHGFHSPDPLMTKELGIPNACSSCHTDEPVDWAVEYAEQWYGEKLAKSRQRQRARTIQAAYEYSPAALPALLKLLETEDIAAWRATYTGLIGNDIPDPTAIQAIEAGKGDESPMVRERAIGALSQIERDSKFALDALSDPSRSVRISASRALTTLNLPISDATAAKDWDEYLEFNIDRPQSLLIKANQAAIDQKLPELRKYLERAIKYDSLNPGIYRQSAILLSMAGLNKEARTKLFTGWEIAPNNATFPYSLGLLAAETEDLQMAIGYLEEAVAIQPDFSRAWYNLSLAYQQNNQPEAAARAMRRAQGQP